jgi:glycosyltransferase involved in cell wall biosynthesis
MNPWERWRSRRIIRALAQEAPTTFVCPFPREQILVTRMQAMKTIWVVHAPFRYLAHRLFVQHTWVRAANRASAVVPVSTRLGADLKHLGIPLNRLQVIPNSVAIPPSDVAEVDRRTPYLIGTASRLVKAKGIQYMIAAMPEIVARFPHAHLAIAGTGKYEPELRAQVQRLGLTAHVDFLGQLDELLPFYRSLHVFVHPTVDPGEVLPTAILEAASTGTPVVASSLASIPDEVRDGLTGFLTPPADAVAIATSVNSLLGDPVTARAMGNAGRY